ncbi:kinase-like domain-containing protein [Mycena crocata]|nr:kinase-like domain-containing protein [Mycena crocata]
MAPATASSLTARQQANQVFEELNEGEQYWVAHHDWLKECGYMLRPRFRPGWIPSWVNDPRKLAPLCEDGWRPQSSVVMDAVRVSDNSTVLLKKVKKDQHPYEVEIGSFLTVLGRSRANHCVPILHTLQPPNEDNLAIIVMPLLRRFDEPRFETIGEGVEFFRQIFVGLQFMHHHHVAHRDCNSNNIMMDGQHLFPHGTHPDIRHQRLKPNSTYRNATHYTRTQRPVKYYFIDFGLSRRYEPAECPPMEDIIKGGDKSPPEHAIPGQYAADPFATDIYYLGNLIRHEFTEGFKSMSVQKKFGFEFMEPLVADMVQPDPTKRPKIDEVVARFDEIRKDLGSWKLRFRIIQEREWPYLPHRIVRHWYRRIVAIIIRRSAIPTPSI